jgi:hypothetical protein
VALSCGAGADHGGQERGARGWGGGCRRSGLRVRGGFGPLPGAPRVTATRRRGRVQVAARTPHASGRAGRRGPRAAASPGSQSMASPSGRPRRGVGPARGGAPRSGRGPARARAPGRRRRRRVPASRARRRCSMGLRCPTWASAQIPRALGGRGDKHGAFAPRTRKRAGGHAPHHGALQRAPSAPSCRSRRLRSLPRSKGSLQRELYATMVRFHVQFMTQPLDNVMHRNCANDDLAIGSGTADVRPLMLQHCRGGATAASRPAAAAAGA